MAIIEDGSVILNPKEVEDLRELIQYNWNDEARDYRENSQEDSNHIFHSLIRLRNAIGTDVHLTDPE